MAERLLIGFRGLSPSRQIMLVLALSGLVAAAVVGFLWSQESEMQVLFSHLSAEDAGAITTKLKEQKIPYRTAGDGGTIMVPSDKVHELRMQMATQSLPQGGGVGFEIFDRATIGMTDFVQKLNYRRALQGELGRTIAQLAEVERARVHLVVPERSLFTDQRERPRAAVVLTLRRGKTLTGGQIQGIAHLVASSVEGLQPPEVTIVDSHGQVLSQPAGDPTGQQTGAYLDTKQTVEKDLETRVQSMLERVVGKGKAVVRVATVLDLRKIERTEEAYDPNVQVVRSENRSQEKTSSKEEGEGGVAGTTSNLPDKTAIETVGASVNSAVRSNATVNYEINKSISRIIEPAGTVKRLSAAVLVDGSYEVTEAKDGKTQRKFVPRSDDEMKKLEELVKKAVGYSEERGDQVQVLNVSFESSVEDIGSQGGTEVTAANPMNAQYVRYGVFGLLATLVLFFVVRPLIRTLSIPPTMPGQLGLPGMTLPATVGQLEAALGPGSPQTAILETARTHPESTALVVKKWLKEK
jgi:flagellar M-ring protein FliF